MNMNGTATTQQQISTVWKRNALLLAALTGAIPLAAGLALMIGRFPEVGLTPLSEIKTDPLLQYIVFQGRLPRILLALAAGGILAGAGFVFQMIFSNPLVEPNFLGVSQGAAFGASLMIVFGASPMLIQFSAAGFGLLGLLLSWALATRFRFGGWILRLILAGIAVSAAFSAALGFIKLVADPVRDLQSITFWMMGGLWGANMDRVASVAPIVLLGFVVMIFYRWRLNLLALHDRTAHSIGMAPIRDKTILLFVVTIGVTSIISVTGLIGWVGLLIPHLSRKVFGADGRYALPGAIVIGALFLLACDTLARTILPGEIPVGLFTSIIGAIGFAIILMQRREGSKS